MHGIRGVEQTLDRPWFQFALCGWPMIGIFRSHTNPFQSTNPVTGRSSFHGPAASGAPQPRAPCLPSKFKVCVPSTPAVPDSTAITRSVTQHSNHTGQSTCRHTNYTKSRQNLEPPTPPKSTFDVAFHMSSVPSGLHLRATFGQENMPADEKQQQQQQPRVPFRPFARARALRPLRVRCSSPGEK